MLKAKKKRQSSSKNTILKKLEKIERKQNEILKIQKKVLAKEEILESEEEQELEFEKLELISGKNIEREELKEIEELKKLLELEESIKKEVKVHPLTKITKRDVVKGMLGALFGVVGHFSFVYGIEIAENYSYTRSSFLFATSFVIIVMFLYFAGFRKVNDHFVYKILPIRALVIYFSAIITIVLVLLLYGKITFYTDFQSIYNTVAAISVLAVLGAGAADLLGKGE